MEEVLKMLTNMIREQERSAYERKDKMRRLKFGVDRAIEESDRSLADFMAMADRLLESNNDKHSLPDIQQKFGTYKKTDTAPKKQKPPDDIVIGDEVDVDKGSPIRVGKKGLPTVIDAKECVIDNNNKSNGQCDVESIVGEEKIEMDMENSIYSDALPISIINRRKLVFEDDSTDHSDLINPINNTNKGSSVEKNEVVALTAVEYNDPIDMSGEHDLFAYFRSLKSDSENNTEYNDKSEFEVKENGVAVIGKILVKEDYAKDANKSVLNVTGGADENDEIGYKKVVNTRNGKKYIDDDCFISDLYDFDFSAMISSIRASEHTREELYNAPFVDARNRKGNKRKDLIGSCDVKTRPNIVSGVEYSQQSDTAKKVSFHKIHSDNNKKNVKNIKIRNLKNNNKNIMNDKNQNTAGNVHVPSGVQPLRLKGEDWRHDVMFVIDWDGSVEGKPRRYVKLISTGNVVEANAEFTTRYIKYLADGNFDLTEGNRYGTPEDKGGCESYGFEGNTFGSDTKDAEDKVVPIKPIAIEPYMSKFVSSLGDDVCSTNINVDKSMLPNARYRKNESRNFRLSGSVKKCSDMIWSRNIPSLPIELESPSDNTYNSVNKDFSDWEEIEDAKESGNAQDDNDIESRIIELVESKKHDDDTKNITWEDDIKINDLATGSVSGSCASDEGNAAIHDIIEKSSATFQTSDTDNVVKVQVRTNKHKKKKYSSIAEMTARNLQSRRDVSVDKYKLAFNRIKCNNKSDADIKEMTNRLKGLVRSEGLSILIPTAGLGAINESEDLIPSVDSGKGWIRSDEFKNYRESIKNYKFRLNEMSVGGNPQEVIDDYYLKDHTYCAATIGDDKNKLYKTSKKWGMFAFIGGGRKTIGRPYCNLCANLCEGAIIVHNPGTDWMTRRQFMESEEHFGEGNSEMVFLSRQAYMISVRNGYIGPIGRAVKGLDQGIIRLLTHRLCMMWGEPVCTPKARFKELRPKDALKYLQNGDYNDLVSRLSGRWNTVDSREANKQIGKRVSEIREGTKGMLEFVKKKVNTNEWRVPFESEMDQHYL